MTSRLALILMAPLALSCLQSQISLADSFGNGEHTFDIEFVPIGNPNNPPDDIDGSHLLDGVQHLGSVGNSYRIGKFEVSISQIKKANALAGLDIPFDMRDDETPATSVGWFGAARFINWLNTSSGSVPAYKEDGNGGFALWEPSDPGYDSENLFRNTHALYFLPSADEWYKAAYYDPTTGLYYRYPTGATAPKSVASGTEPNTAVYAGQPDPANVMLAGGLSPYGTMGQGGNASEWEETAHDLVNDDILEDRGGRGGEWDEGVTFVARSTHRYPFFVRYGGTRTGFRVASRIPEPRTLSLTLLATLCISLLVKQSCGEKGSGDKGTGEKGTLPHSVLSCPLLPISSQPLPKPFTSPASGAIIETEGIIHYHQHRRDL